MPMTPTGTPSDHGASQGSRSSYANRYFETRLAPNPHRRAVWRHICAYLERWIPPDAEVLELGAGWCEFANNVRAKRVVAMDVAGTVQRAGGEGVPAVVGDCPGRGGTAADSYGVVLAPTLRAALERPAATARLAGARRVLRPGGRLVLVQPNYPAAP